MSNTKQEFLDFSGLQLFWNNLKNILTNHQNKINDLRDKAITLIIEGTDGDTYTRNLAVVSEYYEDTLQIPSAPMFICEYVLLEEGSNKYVPEFLYPALIGDFTTKVTLPTDSKGMFLLKSEESGHFAYINGLFIPYNNKLEISDLEEDFLTDIPEEYIDIRSFSVCVQGYTWLELIGFKYTDGWILKPRS